MNIKTPHFFLVIILTIQLTPVSAQNNSPQADGRTVKLSPKIRVLEREQSIPTIPMEVIQAFLNRPKLISEQQIQQSSYVLANAEQSLLSTKGSQIYVTGLEQSVDIGTQYMIIKVGQLYRNPPKDQGLAGEVLAREAVYLGQAVLQIVGEPAVFLITDAVMEIKAGDLLVPLEKEDFTEDFYPHSPTTLTNASIIAMIDHASVVGQYQIIVVNQGSKQGLERGHILTVLKAKKMVHRKNDEEQVLNLPPRLAGEILIFKVFKNVSYALVMNSTLPIQVHDQVSVP